MNHPNTMAKAVPGLTFGAMQGIPMATKTSV